MNSEGISDCIVYSHIIIFSLSNHPSTVAYLYHWAMSKTFQNKPLFHKLIHGM